ncbi:MAG: bifunctional glycosyltransferase family 2/GtrA family protein, partial [Clostridia bacterium]|nr:bifunctional glycosyltransferase family 2/GtrA family protein [Clostridia bacterium]
MIEAKKELIVVIPAYEPPNEFIAYAEEVSGVAKALVVVNDGSRAEFDPVFDTVAALPNVVYLRYPDNHGKGYALKTAFSYICEHFPATDIVVTADCDGQHKLDDVLRVFGATASHITSLVLGSRNFDLPNVPKRSRAGNVQTRRLFRFFYGLNLYDTQTGLRGCSVELTRQFLAVRGDRFEYEMGVLIYAQKHEIPVLETPITTVYPKCEKDHVSHFKTFSDSARVMGVLLKNLNFYMLSSALSAVADVVAFFLLSTVFFKEITALHTLIATVGARIISSILNFTLNFKYVFGGAQKRSILRYYILWFFQLGASYALVFLFGNLIGLPRTPIKAICDLLLALMSYQIQQHWVFRRKAPVGKFYTPLLVFAKAVARAFSPSYRCDVLPSDDSAVYVCRHLNMHGPYACLKWLKFQTHPMVLSVFFNRKTCYEQFRNYTFTEKKGKKKRTFHPLAFFCSLFVPVAVRGLRSIPVYRRSIDCVKTFRASLFHLEKGESILVFPDIDYAGTNVDSHDIYDGFLYLGELYHRKTGKGLKF